MNLIATCTILADNILRMQNSLIWKRIQVELFKLHNALSLVKRFHICYKIPFLNFDIAGTDDMAFT